MLGITWESTEEYESKHMHTNIMNVLHGDIGISAITMLVKMVLVEMKLMTMHYAVRAMGGVTLRQKKKKN